MSFSYSQFPAAAPGIVARLHFIIHPAGVPPQKRTHGAALIIPKMLMRGYRERDAHQIFPRCASKKIPLLNRIYNNQYKKSDYIAKPGVTFDSDICAGIDVKNLTVK